MTAKIIVGSLFGDEGKGITTDYLCKNDLFSALVVRYNGGQQAGHNVKIGKVSHIHSNFGSGTLRGVHSYFSEHCTIYPVTMVRELSEFASKNISPEVYYHPLANLTTPADVAYNRWKEKKLNHGSCGIGVGATMKRNIETPYKVYAIDLLHRDILLKKCQAILHYYVDLIGIDNSEIEEFYDLCNQEFPFFNEAIKVFNVTMIKDYDFLKYYDNIVFEGAQGIMLDVNHGIFPNVTYGNTTSKNALEICERVGIKNPEIFYVTRCYQTRHGAGWMSNESEIKLTNTQDEINVYNDWQKDFRIGEIDYNLLNYAYSIDNLYSKNIPKNLVVTCLDQRPGFEFEYNKLRTRFKKIYNSYSADSKSFLPIQDNYGFTNQISQALQQI
jgi:adenylosuccinate synthase